MMVVRRRLGRSRADERTHGAAQRQAGEDRKENETDSAARPIHILSIHVFWRSRFHSLTRRSRNAFPITDTELNVIAALAIVGLSSRPKNGYRTPAPMGTPITL